MLILLTVLLVCGLVDCSKKEKRVERAILLGFLLGSSSGNNHQTYYPQQSMPIFLPTSMGYG